MYLKEYYYGKCGYQKRNVVQLIVENCPFRELIVLFSAKYSNYVSYTPFPAYIPYFIFNGILFSNVSDDIDIVSEDFCRL